MSRFNAALLLALVANASQARKIEHSQQMKRVRGHALLQKTLEVAEKPVKGVAEGWEAVQEWVEETKQKLTPVKIIGDAKCGITVKVTSKDNKAHYCPKECPYYAQDKTDDDFCTFRCVPARGCAGMNPEKPIADDELGVCRAPMVQSCSVYNTDGTDTCKECNSLYKVGPDGQCHSKFAAAVYTLSVLFGLMFIFMVVWVADMAFRPHYNEGVLLKALDFRSHQKLRTSKKDGRKIWPLTTNLLRTPAAGAGMLLHYNFQVVVIGWALIIGIGWIIMAATVDRALFILGTRKFGTPRDNCILVAWGWETQQRLMWTKCLFLVLTYVLTFAGSIWHSIRQLRLFQSVDYENKTMKDFVGICEGMPRLSGEVRVEDELKKALVSATGEPLVGVSIAWDFRDQQDLVLKYLENDMVKRDPQLQSMASADASEPEDMNIVRKNLYAFEKQIFVSEPEDPDPEQAAKVKEALLAMHTGPAAFAVFETESSRNAAIRKLEEAGGLNFHGSKVQLKELLSEPDTVEWQNFGHSSTGAKVLRLFQGFGCIFLALLFWSVVFYAPYAWSVATFNYDNGQQPGPVYSISFSMVVVIGNQIMYEVCARVSDFVGFRFKDTRQVCYMILFTVACLYNVMVDMATTYFVAEQVMTELGFRTYFGVKLQDVPTFTERFESYPLQRALAENTYSYAFPSTFLIPFLLEPIATIYAPMMIGIFVVGSHKEVRGREAEGWLAGVPMDMGRYADVLLNMVLGIMIFYFPGGWTHRLFLGMAFSHMYIYFFDHCRLLRSVPSITVATMEVDWACQALLAPVCGVVLACLVFKANCHGYGYCVTGMPIIMVCIAAWFAHCVVHLLLLVYVVPLFSKAPPEDDPCKDLTFKAVAANMPCSWFTTNPVHCLRSQFVYKHNPPCRFWFSGKEHTLERNEAIGCYFHDSIADTECFAKMSRSLTQRKLRLEGEQS